MINVIVLCTFPFQTCRSFGRVYLSPNEDTPLQITLLCLLRDSKELVKSLFVYDKLLRFKESGVFAKWQHAYREW
jgi:hypothetical protein